MCLAYSIMSSTTLDRAIDVVQSTRKSGKNMGVKSIGGYEGGYWSRAFYCSRCDELLFNAIIHVSNGRCRRVNKSGISKTKMGLSPRWLLFVHFYFQLRCTYRVYFGDKVIYESDALLPWSILFIDFSMYVYCLYQILLRYFLFRENAICSKNCSLPQRRI